MARAVTALVYRRPVNAIFEGERPRHWLRRATAGLAFVALVTAVGAAVAGAALYLHFEAGVPDIDRLEDYRPKRVTRIFGQEGQIIGELYDEKRIVLPYDELPPRLVEAFIASEDDGFFDHGGIDFLGILRAAIANLRAGRVVQGGSTITQQVAKSLLISLEGYGAGTAKNISRKIREAILARRLEARLSKADILTVYLNQIFLGNQSYGIAAAAENYFRKPVAELKPAEIALLAGLPQAPSRYSPIQNPAQAKKRREYVLRRMREVGLIDQAELEEAENTPVEVHLAPNHFRGTTPYFTEEVRRELSSPDMRARLDLPEPEEGGVDPLLIRGLRVFTTVDVERYRAAEDAVYEQLRMVDRRQGYRGPLLRLSSPSERKAFLAAHTAELAKKKVSAPVPGELYPALVTEKDSEARAFWVAIGPHRAALPLIGLRWARPVDPQVRFDAALLTRLPSSIEVGDVVLVRATTLDELRKKRLPEELIRVVPSAPSVVVLEQEPVLETAVLSVHNPSGYVLAMLGGYSFEKSEFNRATQSCRQPGSAFKPVVYAGALQILDWTPSSTVLDAPVAFNDASAKNRWKPENFGGGFEGEVCLRYALMKSMNLPAIRVLDALGIGRAIRWARHLGLTTELRPELGLALGASCVRMAELVDVYRTFANGGRLSRRRLITRVEDHDGRVLFDDGWPLDPFAGVGRKLERALVWTASVSEPRIDPENAYLITKMMRNVVEGGTGTPAKAVGVPVAGKTGTTNDSFDAWFVGTTTELTTAVWVGFDDYVTPMGRYEQGGRAALPIWVDYMKEAVKHRTGDFEPPPSIVTVRIDGKTGRRAPPGARGSVMEAFRQGTEPKESVARAGEAPPDQLLMQDMER